MRSGGCRACSSDGGCGGDWARRMGARARLAPGEGMQTIRHAGGHELVPCRMVLDGVDAVSVAIVRLEHGREGVGVDAPPDGVTAGQAADGADALARPGAAFA